MSAAPTGEKKTIDPKALRRCLGSFATGVTVVTTRHGKKDYGITVNSFTSVSLDPPLVLWCLARTSRTYPVFTAAKHFVINVLSVDQVTVSNRFAFRSDDDFPGDVAFSRAVGDAPLLEGVCAHFQCRRTEIFDGGDHVVVVGEVIDFAGSDRPGLVYREGQYAVADTHPSAAEQSREALGQGFLDTTVRPALEDITRKFEGYFDEELREAGISSREAQVLGLLLSRGPLGKEEISNQTLVAGSFLEETLETLVGKELITESHGIFELTPSGQTLASDWFERLGSFKAKALGSIDPAEAEALQRTLARLSDWISTASHAGRRSS